MRVELLSLSVTFAYEFEIYGSTLNSYWSYRVRGFDVLENVPFKSVVDTQISQKMISPENT